MRVLALVSALGEGDPVAWVEALAAIIARAHVVDDADAIEALETLTHAVADPSLGYETKKRLYVAASDLIPEVNPRGFRMALVVFLGVAVFYAAELALGSLSF